MIAHVVSISAPDRRRGRGGRFRCARTTAAGRPCRSRPRARAGSAGGYSRGTRADPRRFCVRNGNGRPISLAGLREKTALVSMCSCTRNRRARPDPGRRVSARRVGADPMPCSRRGALARCKFSRNSVIENFPQRSYPIRNLCAASIRPANTSKPFANPKHGRPPRSSFRDRLGWRRGVASSRFQSARSAMCSRPSNLRSQSWMEMSSQNPFRSR